MSGIGSSNNVPSQTSLTQMADITHDPKQQLFQRCSFAGSNGESRCERIVSKVFTHNVCKLHTELPASMKRPDIKRDLQDAKERAR